MMDPFTDALTSDVNIMYVAALVLIFGLFLFIVISAWNKKRR